MDETRVAAEFPTPLPQAAPHYQRNCSVMRKRLLRCDLLCYNRAMKAADNVTIEDGGKITLPIAVRSRYGLAEHTPVRVIETRTGILLVPLTQEPMSESLADELQAWRSIGAESLEMFPYDEDAQS
jgi:bifunctional DNA-binding transcriptional regulator/antitoxin component of YhaV-PrlF toxin-antitoxin module